MASFKAQYAELLKREGNYHDGTIGGKVDIGGETYRGIARRYNPDFIGWDIIDALKIKGKIANGLEIPSANKAAYDYSKKQYWDKLGLDKVKSQQVADIIFEINWGFPAKTLSTVKSILKVSGTNYFPALVKDINLKDPKELFGQLVDAYASLLRNSSQYYKFSKGYENRILDWIKKRDNFIVAGGIGFGTIALVGLGLFFLAKKRKTRKLTIIA